MIENGKIVIAKSLDTHESVYIEPAMANRHGIIAGATGTGKTVTLKTIAQSMSDAGIPVFLADIKGDVSGMCEAGEQSEKLLSRLESIGITQYDFYASPVRFWDVYGKGGLAVRTTISEMGPVLLSRLLGLTDVQQGVLNIVFHIMDDEGILLLDLKDLRAAVSYVGEHADEYRLSYGNISAQTIGAIQRELLALQDAGGDIFFGEPALDLSDWLAHSEDGKGIVNILNCVELVKSPLLYSTFLLWMLTELYEMLPEAGDLEKPKMCFFFDEAHLLFNDIPHALLEKVEQVVKLIRSKGVGVYFITQNPADIPASVLGQLGNRIQHALRAYTPAEQKGIKAAAESFRENPAFDTKEVLVELGTGEALISCLDEKGVPVMVQRASVIAPGCSMDAASHEELVKVISSHPLRTKYETALDRESAYEVLSQKVDAEVASKQDDERAREEEKQREREQKAFEKEQQRIEREKDKEQQRRAREREKLIKRVTGSVLTTTSNTIVRGILKSLIKK
ncbi:MAG: DUF853 family protein [Eggerthellaceae bacterium]|nr:DUF853 family protein [Eggerthellaceae bacterium]